MAVVHGQRKAEYHPTLRRKVMATALVDLQQTQVIDKNGQIRSVVVWRCGPDILVGETMDALFDAERRFKAPNWLVEQLDALPANRRFDSLGNAIGDGPEEASVSLVQHSGEHPDFVEDDDDVPGVKQA